VANDRDVTRAIVGEASELDVDPVVVGARGLAGVRAFLGSVSNHVLQHSRQPVLVIPASSASKGEANPEPTAGVVTASINGRGRHAHRSREPTPSAHNQFEETHQPSRKGALVATTTHNDSRTAHLLELMAKGDSAFNARDFETVDTVHDPDMIAYIPGSAEPIYGSKAHSAAMQAFLRSFPDMRVNTPYPIQFGSGDWITVITNATGTFTGEMVLPDGKVIAPTGKAFDLEFGQTTKWKGDRVVVIAAFMDARLQQQQLDLA